VRAGSVSPGPRPHRLAIGDRLEPVAVEPPFGFGWLLDGAGGDGAQAAYQVQVHRGGALVWDSGRVASS